MDPAYYNIPHLYVGHERICEGDQDVNCFQSGAGCSQISIAYPASTYTYCNGTAESTQWSFSISFIGSGIDIFGGIHCGSPPCSWARSKDPFLGWTIDDNPISSWVPDENLTIAMTTNGSTYNTHMLLSAHNIPGGDSAQHTLSLTSEDPTSTSLWPVLRYAVIQTGAQTPVHPLDNIWVSARHPGMKYSGQWFDREFPSPGMRQTNVANSSSSFDFVGDTYSHVFIAAGQMTRETHLDGIRVGSTAPNNSGFEPGWHDLNVTVSKLSIRDGLFSLHGLWYHPLPNVTRMLDTYSDTGTQSQNEPMPDASSGPNVKAIVGGAVGGFVAVVLLVLCVVFLRRRGRMRGSGTLVLGSSADGSYKAKPTPSASTVHPFLHSYAQSESQSETIDGRAYSPQAHGAVSEPSRPSTGYAMSPLTESPTSPTVVDNPPVQEAMMQVFQPTGSTYRTNPPQYTP